MVESTKPGDKKQELLKEIDEMNEFTKNKTFDQILDQSEWKNEDVKMDDGRVKEKPVAAASEKDKKDGDFEGGGIHTNDDTTVRQYFNYYAKLANQQNMLQDEVRTPKYREAIIKNPSNFLGKVVMDVGCGSGILSLFAA